MKKNTMMAIANYIKNVPELAAEYAELDAEINKGAAKAQANRELYDAAREVVLAHMTTAPTTVADLFTLVEAELPNGFTKSKMQYALTHYWTDKVVKIENVRGANEYRLAV